LAARELIGSMKRHSVRLLKYLTVAALFLTLGPVTVKLMFGDDRHERGFDERRHLRREPLVDHGLPVDPDDMHAVAIKYSPVLCPRVYPSVCLCVTCHQVLTGPYICIHDTTRDAILTCNQKLT